MNRELVFLRTFATAAAVATVFVATTAFNKLRNKKFTEIDVERINMVEKDGTVKMIITNTSRFPNGTHKVNNKAINESRKKEQAPQHCKPGLSNW
jgi:hypothetical protein